MLWEEPGRLGPGASCLPTGEWPRGNGVGEHEGWGYGSRCLWGTSGHVHSHRYALECPVPKGEEQGAGVKVRDFWVCTLGSQGRCLHSVDQLLLSFF